MSKLDWESEAIKAWKKEAVEIQEWYGVLLINKNETWEGYQEFSVMQRPLLELKIGYALFGPSKELVNEKFDSILDYKYNEKQKEAIKIISDVIYKNLQRNRVEFACIFLICYTENGSIQYPLFRILNKDLEPRFVDIEGRVYKHWSDFVENNKLPECFYCYPENGVYRYAPNGELYSGFEESPECKIGKKVLVGLDRFSIGASLGSAGLLMGSALTLPISGPVVLAAAATGVACGMWSTGRAIDKLVDRSKHNQDIGLKSAEGRGCWLDISTGIVGTCSMGLAGAAKVVKTGGTMSKVIRIASIAGGISTMTVAGASVVNHIYEIIDKKNFTRTDVMNLAVAVFFFTNSIVNIKTSIKVLQEKGNRNLHTSPSNNDCTTSRNVNISQRPRYISSAQEILDLFSKFEYFPVILTGYNYINGDTMHTQKENPSYQTKETYSTNTEDPQKNNLDNNYLEKTLLKHRINDLLDSNQHKIFLSTGVDMEMLFENVDSSDLNDMLESLALVDSERIDAILVTLVDVLIKTRLEGLTDIKKLSDSLISYIIIACRLISVTNDYSSTKLSSFLILMFDSDNYSSDYNNCLNSMFEVQFLTKMKGAMSLEFLNRVYAKIGGYQDVYLSDLFRSPDSGVGRLLDICKVRWEMGESDGILNLVITLIHQYFSPNMKRNGNELILSALKLVIFLTSVYSTIDQSKIISLKDLINYI